MHYFFLQLISFCHCNPISLNFWLRNIHRSTSDYCIGDIQQIYMQVNVFLVVAGAMSNRNN
jgi:hypothetical protein